MSQTLNINYDPYAPGTFALTFTVNGVAPNLSTGYGATMRIWRSGLPTTASPDVTVTHPTAIALGTSGSIILDLVVIHAALALVSSTNAVWVYDLVVTPTGSYSQKVCSGQLAEGVGSDQAADVTAPISVNWAGTVGGDLAGTLPNPTVDGLQGRAVASTAPTNGQVLAWNSSTSVWEPTAASAGSGTVTSITPAADTGTGTAITTAGTITISGTANEIETSVSGTTVTVGLPNEITVVDVNTERIDFDTTPTTPTDAIGREYWDTTYNTLSLGLTADVNLKAGQALYKRARNASSTTAITKGQVVYISGSHALTELMVDLADADTEATSAETVGVAAETIPANSTGFVQVFGYLTGLTTNGYTGAEGTALYLSSTAGDMTSTLPTQPKHGIRVGFLVKKAGSGAGSIFVNIQNYQELEELSDVLISGKAEKDLLSWDNTALVWKNRTIANAGVAAAVHTHAASDVTSGTLDAARLGSGTANSGTWLRGDSTWQALPTTTVTSVTEYTYTSSSTYSKPAGLQYIVVEGCGGGGGGSAGSTTAGGLGGCAGVYATMVIHESAITTSTLTVTIGTGGTSGSAGNNSELQLASGGAKLAIFNGGRSGTNSTRTIVGGVTSDGFGAGGIAGGDGRHGGYAAGGGGGGAATVSVTGSAGGAPASLAFTTTTASGGGGAAGGAILGGNGTNASATLRGFGEGGGGGGGHSAGTGGTGGNGTRGSGGGGGGRGSAAGGNGGTGGDGFIRIIEVVVA